MFSFYFLDLKCTIPYPNNIQPPVWTFKLGCTLYTASIHVHKWIRLYATMILSSFIVCFRYYNTHLNFALSSLVLLVTLVHRNDIAGSMSGLPLFATIECRVSASFFLVLLNSHRCSVDPYLLVMTTLRLDPLQTNQLVP